MRYRWCSELWIVATILCSMILPSCGFFKKQFQSSDDAKSDADDDPVWKIRDVFPSLDLENNSVTDIKVNVGEVAYLPCRFPHTSNSHQVSWIKRWNWHILTTGTYTYTSDIRFNVLHKEGSDDWTLQLKYVDTKDDGTYDCQMYTGTGVMSQYVNLHVIKPRAKIFGPSELHVEEGDTISLVCEIQQSKPPFVFWYHGDNMFNSEGDKHRLNVVTAVEGAKTHSTLTINDARLSDSGNYSCIPPNVDSSFVMVYVTNGEAASAIHQLGFSSAAPSAGSSSILVYFISFMGIILCSILSRR